MDGIINVLKPPGLTSRQVVSMIKRITNTKKVGHSGTLDPGACGTLPIMLGKATRLFDILGEETKEYVAEFTFGQKMTTQDSYGVLVKTEDVKITKEQVDMVLKDFLGVIEQTPSIYSAVHIDGKRAYDYAFKGQEIEMPKRKVTIHEIETLNQSGDNKYIVRVLCSKGCYIRSICEDVAKKLGTIAYMSFLLRTKTGGFSIENTVTIDELEESYEKYVTKIDDILSFMPRIKVKYGFTKMLHNGNKLPLYCTKDDILQGVQYCVYDFEDNLCGIGIQDEDIFRIKILLRDKNECIQ